MGHPGYRKFEADFKTLLDGGKLTGKGTSEDGDGGKAMSADEISAAVKVFQDGVAAAKSAIGDDGKKFERAFLVLVKESKYDAKSNEFKTDFTHHQILVGPKAELEILKNAAAGLIENGRNGIWRC